MGHRGSRFALEYMEWQGLGADGNPDRHTSLARRILDRTAILPIVTTESPICLDIICAIVGCDICKHIKSTYKVFFHKKRGT